MEALVHAELANKRYSLREGCSRCGRKHTEWFAVTLEEVQRVMDDWYKVAASPLYTEDRILSEQWRRVIVESFESDGIDSTGVFEGDPIEQCRQITWRFRTAAVVFSKTFESEGEHG